MDAQRTKELALALTAMPSVTDSEGETRFGGWLRDFLAEWPYFSAHPERLRLLRTLEDGRERYFLVAAAGGEERPGNAAGGAPGRAVILTGHYDVVGTRDYGQLESLAFKPGELATALVAELAEAGKAAAAKGEVLGRTEGRARHDLESGEFIPGRGLLDMKSGLAAGLALLEDFAAEALSGGASGGAGGDAIVFLAVPDEEGSSHGMLSAVRALPDLLSGWGLEALAAINLDAAVDQGDGEAGRAIFLGSIGKLHPFVLFVGRPSHASAPFDGINPALMAAEFARRVECSPTLFRESCSTAAEAASGAEGEEAPPPPTILYYRELRDHYDVTTPASVFVSVNVLSVKEGPAEILAALSCIADDSMEAGIDLLRERAMAFARGSGRPSAPPDKAPRVIPWAELEAFARESNPGSFEEAENAAMAASADNVMEAIAGLAETAVRLAGIEGPVAIIGLAPPYYPRSRLDPERDRALLDLIERERAALEAEGLGHVSLRPSFPGISDMSFLYPEDEVEARVHAARACPLGLDPLPAGFACPAINIGPWGREYHQRLERVNAHYAFEVLPRILSRIARAMLADKRLLP